jgi:rubrerythrin
MLDVEHAMLADSFRDLLDQERQAESTYAELLSRTENAEAREQIEDLLREKKRHIQLVERLLEIVE